MFDRANLLLTLLLLARWFAARVWRLADGGLSSSGTTFVRADLLFPSSTKDVGPSTMTLFHGGEIGRGVLRGRSPSSTSLRFLLGGSPLRKSSMTSATLELCAAARPFFKCTSALMGDSWPFVEVERPFSCRCKLCSRPFCISFGRYTPQLHSHKAPPNDHSQSAPIPHKLGTK